MKNKHLVSVIVPAYNVQKYIDDCIRSIVAQTYSNLEIVLVNDGSTDRSGEKCDEWTQKDKRIKVIHKKNEGLNYARRDGFRVSTGSFVTFVDSDDLLSEYCIEDALNQLLKTDSEAVIFSFSEFSDQWGAPEPDLDTDYKIKTLHGKDTILKYTLLGESSFSNSHYMTAWGKLYKRRLVEAVDWKISNYRSYEDNFWTPQVISGAKRLVLYSKPLYFYRRNEPYGATGNTLGGRLVGNLINSKPVGYIELVDILYKFYEKLAKKHNVEIRLALKDARHRAMWGRFGSLIRAGLLTEENNLPYLKQAWAEHNERDAMLEEMAQELIKCRLELERARIELDKFQSIKHTSLRLAENIKHKVQRLTKKET